MIATVGLSVAFVLVILELSQQCALGSLRQQETRFHKVKFCCSSPAERFSLTIITVKCLAASAIGRYASASRHYVYKLSVFASVRPRYFSNPLTAPISAVLWVRVRLESGVCARQRGVARSLYTPHDHVAGGPKGGTAHE